MSTTDEKVVDKKVDSNKLVEGDDQVGVSETRKSEEGDTEDSPTPTDDQDKKSGTSTKIPDFQYSRDELMAIKELPLSKKRPDCLLTSFNNSRGVWDPERWHLNQKRSETPPDDGGKGDTPLDSHKRRSGDPRERLRKEQDGIVLSPQRRSFTTGCSMSQPPLVRRPESPLGKSDRERDIIHREIPTRRIGSGRISGRERDSWDFRLDRDKDSDSTDFNSFQRGTSSRDRDSDRYERRTYGRDFNERGDRDKDRHRNSRSYGGGDRRKTFSDSREEEPEWFSAGPTSQHDTIELRGFEDIPEEQPPKSKKQLNINKTNAKTNARTLANRKSPLLKGNTNADSRSSPPPPANKKSDSKPTPAPAPTEQNVPKVKAQKNNKSPTPERASPKQEKQKAQTNSDGNDFNFLDDFLKGDMPPELLTNGVDVRGPANSRFSQYFVVDSPINQPDSRRNSLQDELFNNIMHNLAEPSISIPPIGDSEAYFAPISPAANTAVVGSATPGPPQAGVKPMFLLEMLQRSQGEGTKAPSIKDLTAKGKIQSVEELEAQMRRQGLSNKNNSQSSNSSVPKKSDEDVAAFQKLLSQVTDIKPASSATANGPRPKEQMLPVNLMEMFNKASNEGAIRSSQQPATGVPPTSEPVTVFSNASSQPTNPSQAQPANSQQNNMHVPQDLVMKLIEVQRQQHTHQQDMFNKLMASNQQQNSNRLAQSFRQSLSPLPLDIQQMINNGQSNRELLQRPEAQAILQGLSHGDLTPQHLMSQLQNPATQPRQRELLANILKAQGQPGISPRANSPHMPIGPQPPDMLHQIMLQQQTQQHQQQQLRIPSPHNNVIPRIPSPHELVVHTQNIMQSALIKKKLEEQRENFRKRQEMQQSVSPNNLMLGGGPPRSDSMQQKSVSSPTPLAFTPTSVLRKMTAEKDPEPLGANVLMPGRNELKQPLYPQAQHRSQPVPLQPQQQTNTWNIPPIKMPAGRPIVKGSANFQPYTSSAEYASSQTALQPPLYRLPPANVPTGGYNNAGSRAKMPMTNPPPASMNPGGMPLMNMMMYARPPLSQVTNARAQNKMQAHFIALQQQQQQQHQQHQHQQQHQHHNMAPTLQHLLLGQNYGNSNRSSSTEGGMRHQSQPMPIRQSQSMNMHGGSDLSTSPTSNQLAQWFSPELLAQAKAGRLAGMPPISAMQNILSLEELERLQQSSAAVHN